MEGLGRIANRRVGGIEVVCRELTVGQLRGVIASDISTDILGSLLFEDVRLSNLEAMTNLTAEQIEGLEPSLLREVISGCKEANPDFFAMLARAASPQAKP